MRRWLILSGLVLALSACNFNSTAATSVPASPTVKASQNAALPATTAAPTKAPNTTAPNTTIPTTIPNTSVPPTNTTVADNSTSPTTVAVANTVASDNTSGDGGGTSANVAAAGPGSRVLAWNPNTDQVVWLVNGQATKVKDLTGDSKTPPVVSCGTNPAGDKIMIGEISLASQITIYPLDGSAPQTLDQSLALSCSSLRSFQYSPDGSKLAFIKYTKDDVPTGANFVTGTLRILKADDLSEITSIKSVASFELGNDGATITKIYPNDKKEGYDADLDWWDGSNVRKVVEITPLQDCQFIQLHALRVGDQVYTLTGEKCKKPVNQWRIVKTDFASGNSTIVSGPSQPTGAFLPTTDPGTMWAIPGGQSLLVSLPNGLEADIADLVRFSLSDNSVTPVITGVVMDRYVPIGPRRFRLSPNGNVLAMITRDGNGTERMYGYDLTKPDDKPVAITDAGSNDRITGMAWAADSSKVYFTLTGSDPSLFWWSPGGNRNRLVRGTFLNLAITPDGAFAAMTEKDAGDNNTVLNDMVIVPTANEDSKTVIVKANKNDAPLIPLAIR